MAFLCQVLQQLRNADGQPFRPLVTPVYIGLEMLLDDTASERELEVAVTQVKGRSILPLLRELVEFFIGSVTKAPWGLQSCKDFILHTEAPCSSCLKTK